MRTISITIAIIIMALVVTNHPTNNFQPRTVWEHYCKYNLHIHPSQEISFNRGGTIINKEL